MSARKLFSKSPLDTFGSLLCRRGGVLRIEALHGRLLKGGRCLRSALRPRPLRSTRRALNSRAPGLSDYERRARAVSRDSFPIFDLRFLIYYSDSDFRFIIRTQVTAGNRKSKIKNRKYPDDARQHSHRRRL